MAKPANANATLTFSTMVYALAFYDLALALETLWKDVSVIFTMSGVGFCYKYNVPTSIVTIVWI
jgi:hypothetical protein